MRWADVDVTGAKAKTWTRSSDNGNPVACSFCDTCGTRLWHEPAVPGFVHIKPGTLDDARHLVRLAPVDMFDAGPLGR